MTKVNKETPKDRETKRLDLIKKFSGLIDAMDKSPKEGPLPGPGATLHPGHGDYQSKPPHLTTDES